MKFINLLGNTRMLINVQNITFVEETKDGCKIHCTDGKSIITGANYEEMKSTIMKLIDGGDEDERS